MCADSTTLSHLAVSGGLAAGMRGKNDLSCCFYHPLGSCSGGGLAGRTVAAAGYGGSCWRSQECSAPSPSQVLCCRLCLTFTGKKEEKGHGKRWPDTLRFQPGQLSRRERHRRSTSCCCGTPPLLDHMNICKCLFVSVCSLRLSPPTSGLSQRGGRRGALPWRGVCLSIVHSLASRREAKLSSVTAPNAIYECRPDPLPLMGWGRPGGVS